MQSDNSNSILKAREKESNDVNGGWGWRNGRLIPKAHWKQESP